MSIITGLPHGCKPPPLTMQHPCNTPQKPRTMAAVSPLHQVVPPPQPNIPSYEGGNLAFNATSRTSSFAAALRKLAKQAVDPVSGEKDLSQISPVSSPALNQGSLTPKRNVSNPPPPPMFLSNHQVSYASSSPPVVTIAPSRPVATHTSDSRKVMDLSSVQQVNNSSALSNGHLQEPLGVKLDTSKGGPRPVHADKWEESSKSLSASSASSQVRPHATIAPLPRPDDSLTSSRGFQPYRGTEESRNTLPHHISLFDHHHPAASYPYTPAFLPPPHLSHPAYRFDDPLYLERYSLLRPPVMPYPQPGMMAPPATFYPNSRYAADLIAQSLSLNSANSSILNHERLKHEEERRMREKEMELDQTRNKEQERQREKEQREKESREREHKEREQREKERKEREKPYREKEDKADYADHKKTMPTSNHVSTSKRTESPSVRSGAVMHCSTNHISPSTTASSSIPLNLVVHAGSEPPKKETELWLPWQQPANQYVKDNNQEAGNNPKHPAFRSQDNQRHHHSYPKEPHPNEKVNLRFSPSILNEKRQVNVPPSDGETKKHTITETKKFDSIHHHITELSNKDHSGHEWRHEKLQKACTNNHRKSHESKKSKEERNNVFQNHQRKAVNGVILKTSPYQNEGMHARLLESEKCRMEMNGHMLQKPHVVGSVNDRLVPPTYKTNYLPSKDTSPQKLFPDSYNVPVLKSNVDLTPVVSKLDLEAKNMEKNDLKCIDDDGKEELRLKNFLIITKGPPLKFDPNPQKIKFLKLLGLTTHFKRKKIEFDMYLKRRKILLEDSEIPPLSSVDEDEKSALPSVNESSPKMEYLAEKLRSETTPEKLEFFLKIGLTPITLVKKEEKERIRRIVEEEKLRRHYRILANVNRKTSPRRLFVPKSEAAHKLDHIRKMKERNCIANGWLSKRPLEEEEQMYDSNFSLPSQISTPKTEQVPYPVTAESSDVALPPSIEDAQSHSSVNKSFNKYSFKRGHSLKNEWRFAEPKPPTKHNHMLTTQSQSGLNDSATNNRTVSCNSVSTQVDLTVLGSATESKSLAVLKNSFNWPGLEAIMEAFYRHQNEQSSEKTILSERCHHLRHSQEELKREADSLSKQMSELLKCKRELEEERLKYQHSIDRLKKCLQLGR
ncbi:genetic suppressor element 1-like isoform X2 [Stegodyphus dumicola]|uniref:genetic suppressor element 1-like isoform X2 n=1 Tax=Stegodyphus dumicola TaxID=202533 RepID=UPI0015AF50BC|nr:genetic suppressor element 1-like isoform X2 [Stegodyphus dumicola]